MRRRIGLGVATVLMLLSLGLWLRGNRSVVVRGRRPVASSAERRRTADFAPVGAAASSLAAPRGTITGRVTEPDGRAIAGALVCAQGGAPDLSAAELRAPACAPSDRDGRYRLTSLYAAVWEVNASAARHQPGRFREAKREDIDLAPGEERTGVDLILRPGGVEARGRVKDIGGGVVAGAIVQVSPANVWWDAPGAVARSDDKGEWRAWVAPGRVRAAAQAAGYAPGSHEGMAPGSFIEVLLTPESVLVGRVVEAGSGAPVAGALISTGSVSEPFSMSGAGEASALSDPDGHFRIERLEPGRYKPIARSLTRYGQARESVALGLGERSAEVLIESGRWRCWPRGSCGGGART
jgi:hypothetical protein